MNIIQITETLEKFYREDNHRVIFWNDAEGEFIENLDALVPADVKLLRADKKGALAAKIQIELEEPEQKFLVYSPIPTPDYEDDWLLDIRLYSKTFTADAASLLLNELGLQTLSLRNYLGTRKQFLAGKDRLQKLKKWIQPDDTEKDLDRKILAVTVRADQPENFTILLKIFGDFIREPEKSGQDLNSLEPEFWKDIVKFNLTESFWKMITENFGYTAANPRLYDLLVHLFVTDLARHAGGKLPDALKNLVLESRAGAANAAVFLANWRTNVAQQENYRKVSGIIERELKTETWLGTISAENLTECETFEAVERRIIVDLRDHIVAPLPSETGDWQNTINARRDRFGAGRKENLIPQLMMRLLLLLIFSDCGTSMPPGLIFHRQKPFLTLTVKNYSNSINFTGAFAKPKI